MSTDNAHNEASTHAQPQWFMQIAPSPATSGNISLIRKPVPPNFQTCSRELETNGNSANDGLGGPLGNRGNRQSSTDQMCWLGAESVSGKPRAADRATTAPTAEAAKRKGRAQWKRTGWGPRDRLRVVRGPLVTGRVGEAATP